MPISEKPQGGVSVALFITSRELTTSQISEQLGLQPTSSEAKGTDMLNSSQMREVFPEGHPPLRYPWHLFRLKVARQLFRDDPLALAKLLEVLLDELLQKIEPVADRLHSLSDRVFAELECLYTFRRRVESLTLPKALLRRIAALDLSLRVVLAPAEGEEEAPGKPLE